MKFILNPLIIVALLTSAAPFAQAGGDSSGGGTIVYSTPGSQPVLLDLFQADPNFREPVAKASHLVWTPFVERVGFDQIDLNTFPAAQLAQKRLMAWFDTSPGFVFLMQGAILINNMHFEFTDLALKLLPANVFGPELKQRFPHAVLNSTIIYRKDIGAVVSMSNWNQLGELSQAGLIIHEALRELQLNKQEPLSNQDIQALTAMIVLRDPVGNETLDNAETFKVETRRAMQSTHDFFAEIKSLSPGICEITQAVFKDHPEFPTPTRQEVRTRFCAPDFLAVMDAYGAGGMSNMLTTLGIDLVQKYGEHERFQQMIHFSISLIKAEIPCTSSGAANLWAENHLRDNQDWIGGGKIYRLMHQIVAGSPAEPATEAEVREANQLIQELSEYTAYLRASGKLFSPDSAN